MKRITALLLAFALCTMCAGISEAILGVADDCPEGQVYFQGRGCIPNEVAEKLRMKEWINENKDNPQDPEAMAKKRRPSERDEERSGKTSEGRGDGWVTYDATGKPQAEIQKRPPDEIIPGKIPPPDPRPMPIPDPARERPKLTPGDVTPASGGKETLPIPEGGIQVLKVEDGDGVRSTGMTPGNSGGQWLDDPPADQQSEPSRKQKLLEERERLLNQQNRQKEKGATAEDREQPCKRKGSGDESWIECPPPGIPISMPHAETKKIPPGEQIPRELPPPNPTPMPVPDPGREGPRQFKPGDVAPSGQSGGDVTPINRPLPVSGKEGMKELKPGDVTKEGCPNQLCPPIPEPPTIVPDGRPHRPGPAKQQAEIEKRPPSEQIPRELPPPNPTPMPVPDPGREGPRQFKPGDVAPSGQSGGEVTPINLPSPQAGKEIGGRPGPGGRP